ncbi:GNAT family N-acetyltransferase [Nocardia sp. NBC_00881]|uniref:GNAT family N-acetyltransferase n=1 Tax=Nocardia sp. NBC_00881 TaxID=2975995 RepID=UPI0038673B18|nr:GNAT family N-acetyltransferase [Nocardia sp. NBC_00881]
MEQPNRLVVRPATRDDVTDMVRVLSAAFAHDDPIEDFVFPDEGSRHRRAPRMLRLLIEHRFLPVGGAEVALVDDKLAGVLLWYPAGYRTNPLRELLLGPQLLLAMGTAVRRGIAVDTALERTAPAEPHLCCVYLGCDPGLQRSGVGRALFGSFVKRSDAQSVPLYGLCKDANVDYYRAFGVEPVAKTVLGRNGPVMNVVARQPLRSADP